MRVAIPFVGDSVGGSHRSIVELVKGLEKRGIDAVVVIHQADGPLISVLESERVAYRYLPASQLPGESPNRLAILFGMVRHFWTVRKLLKRSDIDVVHGNDLRINLTWSLPSRLSGVRFVWHQRTVLSESRYWILIPYLCDHFVAISRFVYDSAPRIIPARKKSLVSNPFETSVQHDRHASREWLVHSYGIPHNTVLIGYVGRLVPWKNVPLLIQGIARIAKSGDSQDRVHVLIVGTGDSDYIGYLTDLVKKLRLRDSVTFAGFSHAPLQVLAGIDIAVMPSIREPFGRTVVEAMIQRTPVVAARAGGHEEIIQNEVNGILFEPESEQDFVRRLMPVIQNPAMRERLAAAAYTEAVRRYGVEKHVDEIVRIYNGRSGF